MIDLLINPLPGSIFLAVLAYFWARRRTDNLRVFLFMIFFGGLGYYLGILYLAHGAQGEGGLFQFSLMALGVGAMFWVPCILVVWLMMIVIHKIIGWFR